MLDKDKFSKKYKTTYKQINEIEKLEDISSEDLEIYTEGEILTGRNGNGDFNKFNDFGKFNRGKTYDTVRNRAINSFKKFIDKKITDGEIEEIWDRIWLSSKKGSFSFAKLLKEMMIGKEEENINITGEGIKFTFDLGDNEGEDK